MGVLKGYKRPLSHQERGCQNCRQKETQQLLQGLGRASWLSQDLDCELCGPTNIVIDEGLEQPGGADAWRANSHLGLLLCLLAPCEPLNKLRQAYRERLLADIIGHPQPFSEAPKCMSRKDRVGHEGCRQREYDLGGVSRQQGFLHQDHSKMAAQMRR